MSPSDLGRFPLPAFLGTDAGARPLDSFLRAAARRVDAFLDQALPSGPGDALAEAMRHAVLAGGKRVRPALAMASSLAVGARAADALPAAGAVELIHAYSLIHDDLPCMDDDDLRRGKPTVHRRYGEAMAVLAGDALHTLAFSILAGSDATASIRVGWIRRLAVAAGPEGMVGGQVLDLAAERALPDAAGLEAIHRAKTGALIGAAAAMGAIAGGASRADVERLEGFGREIGLVFQIVDDLLDEEGTTAALGKTAGKDRARGKATYPAIHGAAAARGEAEKRAAAAARLLEQLTDPPPGPERARAAEGRGLLARLADRILRRRS